VIPVTFVQTKETLTLKASAFGSKCELSKKFMDKVGDCGVTEHVLSFANYKQNKEMKKTDGAKKTRLRGVIYEVGTFAFLHGVLASIFVSVRSVFFVSQCSSTICKLCCRYRKT
jgi:hypothetical protein